MKKKVLLSLVLLTMVTVSMVFAQEDAKRKMKFATVPGGLSVVAMSGISGDIEIPDTYDGKKVVLIPTNAFKGQRGITGVIIPDSVIEIGNSAFQDCTGIIEIKMGDGVTTIGIKAFAGCYTMRAFKGANIGANLKTIRSSAFEGCYRLERIWIRSNVKYIEDKAFFGCTAINRVHFQSPDTRIGSNAFPNNDVLIEAYKAGGKGPYDVVGKTWVRKDS